MASFTVDMGATATTVLGLRNMLADVNEAKRKSVRAAGEIALKEVKRNVSQTKYSLDDLRRMDHPYARRHGKIRKSVLGGRYVQMPYLVHKGPGGGRTGELLRGIRSRATANSFEIEATGQHAKFVLGGTRVMLARDFLVDTLNQRSTQKRQLREIVRILGQELRTQATVRGAKHRTLPSKTEA